MGTEEMEITTRRRMAVETKRNLKIKENLEERTKTTPTPRINTHEKTRRQGGRRRGLVVEMEVTAVQMTVLMTTQVQEGALMMKTVEMMQEPEGPRRKGVSQFKL